MCGEAGRVFNVYLEPDGRIQAGTEGYGSGWKDDDG